ncbi:unnamed protein product [Didymodactylos carnosus]|uniref:Uncharacterized protein n=1 Tax=Didymodactylos carnosus TaxID=1234261 RepID=A0A814Z1B5_9BILA|nr:unnamed protein product [Didymodactylos carnosus]CAF3999834.1 unnamed protein product [Didymodactylos carnosus]
MLRGTTSYLEESRKAERNRTNEFGHLGISILEEILDVPLPQAIIIDYLHITLLRHTKAIITELYALLKPAERQRLDISLKQQRFPHFFNRKMRTIKDLSYVKATELRNMLLYGLLPNFYLFLSLETIARLALCTGLQNLVLHLRSHYSPQYDDHGAFCNRGTSGQEDLIGHISSNRQGTRYYGELITYYYGIDFSLHNKTERKIAPNGLTDEQIKMLIRTYEECKQAWDCLLPQPEELEDNENNYLQDNSVNHRMPLNSLGTNIHGNVHNPRKELTFY